MKRLKIGVMALFACLLTLTGCSKTEYTVKFDSNGGSAVASVTVADGSSVSKPTDPTYAGHTFEGWYVNLDDTKPYDFSSKVTGNMTLKAKWSTGVNGGGNTTTTTTTTTTTKNGNNNNTTKKTTAKTTKRTTKKTTTTTTTKKATEAKYTYEKVSCDSSWGLADVMACVKVYADGKQVTSGVRLLDASGNSLGTSKSEYNGVVTVNAGKVSSISKVKINNDKTYDISKK